MLRVKAKEEFAELHRRPVAAFAAQDVDVLLQALSKDTIKRLLVLRVEVKSGVRSELLSYCLPVASGVDRWHELEFVAKRAFEGEQASF